MAYTTIDKPSDYFNTVLYTGTGSSNAITGVGFQPDLTWVKSRSVASTHKWMDVVRGNGNTLASNNTNAEASDSSIFPSLDSDGFTVAGNTNSTNASGQTYVGWSWLASNTTASNTSGSITSTVSANTTSGFSIVTYTGTGSATTVGHGLGVAPAFIIVKCFNAGSTNWQVYSKALDADKFLELNSTTGELSQGTYNMFNSTRPTSTVFSIGTHVNTNGSGNSYIAYCFSEKKGFSKAFSYTGNGSADGNFTYLGFRPAFIMVKRTDNARDWVIFDNKRNSFNVMDKLLYPNTSGTEGVANTFDFLSNGFKNRSSAANVNALGGSYIGIAFAENPFTTSTGIPTTAR